MLPFSESGKEWRLVTVAIFFFFKLADLSFRALIGFSTLPQLFIVRKLSDSLIVLVEDCQ